MMEEPEKKRFRFWSSALLPIVLLAMLLFGFLTFGPLGVFKATLPPIEEIAIQRIVLEPEQIVVEVINDGPEPVTIAQVAVNEVFWQFDIGADKTLSPLERGRIKPLFPWLEGDPLFIPLYSSNG